MNELAPTISAPAVSIATGRASVHGTWYESDSAVSFTIPTPGGATRTDRIVLRKDWTAQTARLTRIVGTEGAGPPAMTRISGSIWDMSICQVGCTTAGALFMVDERNILQPSMTPPGVGCLMVASQSIANGVRTAMNFTSETYK